jgi:hypothetical protein
MATGVNVSKAVAYAVLSPPAAVSVSKALAYAVVDTDTSGVIPPGGSARPVIICCT